MSGHEITIGAFWTVAIIISLVLLGLAALVLRLHASFQEHRKETEADLIDMAGQLKRVQSTHTEMLAEVRRLVRLQLELLDIKRAELTGDFEVLEEPIMEEPPPAPEQMQAEPGSPFPELDGSAGKAPRHFPKINIG